MKQIFVRRVSMLQNIPRVAAGVALLACIIPVRAAKRAAAIDDVLV